MKQQPWIRGILLPLLIGAFLAPTTATAQCDEICGQSCYQLPMPVWNNTLPRDGVWMTSKGVVNVLMVFVDFPGDDTLSAAAQSIWPVGAPPSFMNTIIDATPLVQSGFRNNITTFYRDMSYGKLVLVGHPYYVQAPKPRTRYEQSLKNDGTPEPENQKGNVPYYVNRDVLKILDTRMSPSEWDQYDIWSFRKGVNYVHELASDGKIDMVMVCYRNVYQNAVDQDFGYRGDGFPDLGGAFGPLPLAVGGGAKQILFGPSGNGGSGVTCFRSVEYPNLDEYIHEVGHFLIGSVERYLDDNTGLWSILGSRNASPSFFMSAMERYQLGWMDYTEISTLPDGTIAELSDFGTTGVAYRYHAGQPDYNDLILENHQGLPSPFITNTQGGSNTYDVVDWSGAKGLFVVEARTYNPLVLCADGRWRWEQDSLRVSDPLYPAFQQSVFRRGAADRADGRTDRQLQQAYHHGPTPKQGKYGEMIASWFDEKTGLLVVNSRLGANPRMRGDGRDCWRADGNSVLSPWSNPSSHLGENPRVATTLAMQVLESSGPNVRVQFFSTTPLAAPPSQPQDLHVALGAADGAGNRHPILTWERNIEPDVKQGGGYEIDRQAPGGAWALIATVAGNSGGHEDASLSVPADLPQESVTYRYRLRAKDTQGLLSSNSDEGLLILGAVIGKGVKVCSASARSVLAYATDDALVVVLNRAVHITVRAYDAIGGMVLPAIERDAAIGDHRFALPTHALPMGRYYCVIEADRVPVACVPVVIMQ